MMKKTLTFLAALFVLGAVNAQTDLIISEYVEGWSNNKALELYNPTAAAINLDGYQVVRYSNGSDAPPATGNALIVLPDYTLDPYKTCVLVLDKRVATGTGQEAPIWSDLEERADLFLCPDYNTSKALYFNGNDGVALEKIDGTLVDLFARWGAPDPNNGEGWTTQGPSYLSGGVTVTADHTLVRKSSVKSGVIANPTVFNALAEYDSLPANTFENLGWHDFDGAPANSIPSLSLDTLYAVSPLASEGDLVLTLDGKDSDAGQTMKYYIIDGNYFKDTATNVIYAPFTLDKLTGKLTVADENALPLIDRDIYMKVAVSDEYAQSEAVIFKIRITDEELAISEYRTIETSLSPNPAQDQFVVKAKDVISQVQVISLTGKMLYKQNANAKTVNVDFALPAGGYIVKTIFADSNIAVDKLIVQ